MHPFQLSNLSTISIFCGVKTLASSTAALLATTTLALSAPGDRSIEEIIADLSASAGGNFDFVVRCNVAAGFFEGVLFNINTGEDAFVEESSTPCDAADLVGDGPRHSVIEIVNQKLLLPLVRRTQSGFGFFLTAGNTKRATQIQGKRSLIPKLRYHTTHKALL